MNAQQRKCLKNQSIHTAASALGGKGGNSSGLQRANSLMLGTALSAIMGLGYGRGSYAQTVVGNLADANASTVVLTGPGTFEAQEGFSVDTTETSGSAIEITALGSDDTSFVDQTGASIVGYDNGIDAHNTGSGSLSVTATGDISATEYYSYGIWGFNSSAGNNFSVNANNVTGAYGGINVSNNGRGFLSITTTGTVSGNGYIYGYGIGAYTSLYGDGITINARDVSGGGGGISARNQGSGSIDVTATGHVVGQTYLGIVASNSANGDDLTINAGSVTGGSDGIRASNSGTGALRITADGNVTGTNFSGIRASNSANGTNLTIFANTATGGLYGIYARNEGAGSLSISASGTITGQTNDGIIAYGYGTKLEIDVENVNGDYRGIVARNNGSGELTITSTGNVDGATSDGINALNYNSGTDLTIIANNVTGNKDIDPTAAQGAGIRAQNQGSGALTIEAEGTVIGHDDYGISASNTSSGTSLIISAHDVTGSIGGISAVNDGSGALSLTVTGSVTGAGDGIYADNASAETLTITIAEGGSVSTSGTGQFDDAIEANANGAVIVNNAGTVTGRVNLSNSNLFTNSGTWDLAGTTSNFNATGDSLVVNKGLIIAASDAGAVEFSAINNLDTFRNDAGGTIRLADGSAGDSFWIDADVTNIPLLNFGSGAGNFIANGGTVELDVVLGGDGSATDVLIVLGNVILGDAPTALAITRIGSGSAGQTVTGIEVVGVGGASDPGAFILARPAEAGAIAYDLSMGNCAGTTAQGWYLCNNGTIGTTAAVFEAMPAVILDTFARSDTLQQRLGARVASQEMGNVTASSRGEADLPVAQSLGPWMRSWGDFADITPDNSTAGTSWEADSWGLEAGIGAILGDHAGGILVGGINLRYSATYADLSNPVGTASLNSEGFGMGASLTWFGHNGFYVDGTAAVDFASIDATSQGGGELLNDHDEVVYSASAEVGQRIELQGGTTLVPQVQLSWGRMRDGALTDNLGNVVSFADRETLTSRLGLTVEQDVTGTSLGAGKVFGFGNVLYDLQGSRTVTVAGTDVTQSGTGDWLELGGGFSLQPTETTNLFGQVSYREAFNGVDGNAIAVSAGWRMQW